VSDLILLHGHSKISSPNDPCSGIDLRRRWFAYDMICQLSFGEPIGFVEQGKDVENLIKNFHDMAPFAAVVGALPWLCKPVLEHPLTRRFAMPKSGDSSGTGKIMAVSSLLALSRSITNTEQFRDRLLEERLKNPKEHQKGDFLDNILAAKNPDGTTISVEEVRTECFVLMVAASDTTAAFFCGFIRYVSETSGVYDKLVKEINEVEAAGKLSTPVATFAEIQEMPYFIACYNETLRYQPSTPMIIPRYVSDGGIEIDGKHVPAGTEIGANLYVVHRDKGIFGKDADVFRPERWLEDEQRAKLMDKYILTWGYGSRVCLGKNIALLETYKAIIAVSVLLIDHQSMSFLTPL
jgi:cytochrome P450